MIILGRSGGRKGGRRPRLTFNPGFPPGLNDAELIRQLTRTYETKAKYVSGSSGGGRSTGTVESDGTQPAGPVFTTLTFTVPDGGSVDVDLGSITIFGLAYGNYYAYRDIGGADTVEAGSFKALHDGATGAAGHTAEDLQPTLTGVLFEGSIAAGQLRVTLSDGFSSGNDITVVLIFQRVAPLF